jgi:2,4-dienoyl-CoA reductase-like NADH-dependent reductase (Old Yellow Enzyme family)
LTAFPNLLATGSLGSLALRNRIAMCPMGTNLGEPDGTVGDRQAAWFEARARGGAGLILVGSVSVSYPAGSYDARQVACSDDAHLPGLRRLVDDVHRHGAAIAAQLVHDGANSLFDIAEGRPLLVPSRKRPPEPDGLSGMVTPDEMAGMMAPFSGPAAAYSVREATDEDLAWVVERFVDAALRAQRAGFDGIELHGGHGYLLHAFASPASNQREDRWGGSVEGRAELLCTVVRAVRGAVGPTFPLWARIGAFEAHRDPGQRIDDALVTMGLAVDAGLDAVHVTAYGEPMVATGIVDGHTPHVPGALLEHAATVRRELGVPVIAMGRITPERAEQALADGAADIIAMGRALIADPDLPNKLAAGRRDRVRPCAYQYKCIGSIFLNDTVRCAVNPEAGEESDPVPSPGPSKQVVVVGGGPAGLECARRLAERGHTVELWEASDRLGGRLALAEVADPDLAGLLAWLIGSAEDAGVQIHLEKRADAESLTGTDVVVWAAGATWAPPTPELATNPGHIRTGSVASSLVLDELRGWLGGYGSLGERVAVVGGGKAAVTLAGVAAARGSKVTLVSESTVLAPELGLPGRFRLVHDTESAGVELRIGSTDVPDADTVLSIGPGQPIAPPEGIEVHLIGDASGSVGLGPAFNAAKRVAESL